MNAAESHRPPILVVEDDPAISSALCDLLDEEGYAVVSVANGQAALDYLRDRDMLPCLILLDLMMPVMNGAEFLAAREADPRLNAIPVVLLSARSDLAHQPAGSGVAGVLVKPVQFEILLAVVARCLR